MRYFFNRFAVFFIIMLASISPARALTPDIFPVPANTNLVPTLTPFMTKTESKLCQVRRLFCGAASNAIIAFSIFLLGIMIMQKKATWAVVMLLVIGITLFASPDKLSKTFGRLTFTFFAPNPLCNCECNLQSVLQEPSSATSRCAP